MPGGVAVQGGRGHHGTEGRPAPARRADHRDAGRHDGGPWGPRREARPRKGRGGSPARRSPSATTPSSFGPAVRPRGLGPSSPRRPGRDGETDPDLAPSGPDLGVSPGSARDPRPRACPAPVRPRPKTRRRDVLAERSPCGMMTTALLLALIAAPAAERSAEPLLLDFHASWCGPCQQMRPAVKELIRMGYRVKSIDIDRSPSSPSATRSPRSRPSSSSTPTAAQSRGPGRPARRAAGPALPRCQGEGGPSARRRRPRGRPRRAGR